MTQARRGEVRHLTAGCEVWSPGGGAPVTLDGRTCEAYPTPQVPRTGDASECHTASAEVVAVLSLSSPSTAS
jgi:hypothetical protein